MNNFFNTVPGSPLMNPHQNPPREAANYNLLNFHHVKTINPDAKPSDQNDGGKIFELRVGAPCGTILVA